MKLLLVEDEKRMADALAEILRQEKYDVDVCYDGTDGLEFLLGGVYDIAVLDVMLPGTGGFDIARTARRHGLKTPILMLTARSDTSDEVCGLDSGADDYLTKPFNIDSLLARLRALTRRNTGFEDSSFAFGDLLLNRGSAVLSCTATGKELALSGKEYRILEVLFINQNQIMSRESISRKVWGYENDSEYNNVEVYISFIRKKIALIGSKFEIKALRGLGYELRIRN